MIRSSLSRGKVNACKTLIHVVFHFNILEGRQTQFDSLLYTPSMSGLVPLLHLDHLGFQKTTQTQYFHSVLEECVAFQLYVVGTNQIKNNTIKSKHSISKRCKKHWCATQAIFCCSDLTH